LDEIESITDEAQVSLPSLVIVEKLQQCMDEANSLGIKKEQLEKSYKIMENMKKQIDDVRQLD